MSRLHSQKVRPEPEHWQSLSAKSKYHQFFPLPKSTKGLFLSALVSLLSLFLSLTGVVVPGRRRVCTVPGWAPTPGCHPQRVPEESWQQAPPPSLVPTSATFSAGGVFGIPSTLPSCWQCPGQRAEHSFPTLCLPSPGHSQAGGFSIGLEWGGGGTGRRP